MSAEAGLDLVRTLVAAVARPTVRTGDLEEILVAAGHSEPTELISRLPATRLGIDLRFEAGDEIPLDQIEAALGRSRTTHSLDEDGSDERYWDLAVAETERVVLVAELDEAGTSVVGVRLTPYASDPSEDA